MRENYRKSTSSSNGRGSRAGGRGNSPAGRNNSYKKDYSEGRTYNKRGANRTGRYNTNADTDVTNTGGDFTSEKDSYRKNTNSNYRGNRNNSSRGNDRYGRNNDRNSDRRDRRDREDRGDRNSRGDRRSFFKKDNAGGRPFNKRGANRLKKYNKNIDKEEVDANSVNKPKRDGYRRNNKRDSYKDKFKKEVDVKDTDVVDTEVEEKSYQDQIEGRNSVLELLEAGKDINKIFITKGEKHGSIKKIIAVAKENKVVIVEIDKQKLDTMSQTTNHQGIIAIVPPYEYYEVEDLFTKEDKNPIILVLDQIEDPHNLGSIIRSAEGAGVNGIIIPKRRAVSVNATVNKVSSGAVEHVKIARVNNISDTLKFLKKENFWIIRNRSRCNYSILYTRL